jgi:hypothetical protein
MAESTSERSPRAASMSSRSRYTRLAVRGLVVAGFAGTAWLLSSSAAHASQTTTASHVSQASPSTGQASPSTGRAHFATDGVSGLVAVLGGDVSHDHDVRAVVTAATDVLAYGLPASTATDVGGEERSTAKTDVVGPRRTVTGNQLGGGVQGLLGSPVFGQVGTALSPVGNAIVPAVRAATGAATASTANLRRGGIAAKARASGPAALVGAASAAAPAHASAEAGAGNAGNANVGAVNIDDVNVAGLTVGSLGAGSVNAGGLGARIEKDGTAKDSAVLRGEGTRHHAESGNHSAGADRVGLWRTHHVPPLPRPAPIPALPGAGLTSGVPSTGSGLNQDGGAPAIVPAATAAATVASNRPDTADDVEARPLIAESPTVSPD